jgi:hypothetical protein
MKASPYNVPQAVAAARADGPMRLAVLAMGLATLVTIVAVLAAGWQLGGLVLRLLGR